MRNRLNVLSALALQLVTILSGLILPRLIIGAFGSEINGLLSSMTQFLSFITLFEGGIGAVVLAALYRPIEVKDYNMIYKIIDASNCFFRKLGISFLIYTFILLFAYPILFARNLSFFYVSSLILILSITTLMQYMFSITYKLLLQADQKIYITNFVTCFTVTLNIILTMLIIYYFPNIHFVKIGSSIIFLLQPLIYGYYVKHNYKIIKNVKRDENVLKDKGSAFSQNLAHFINMNTDILIITIFSSFTSVSIYSVYMLALSALRSIISTIVNSYQAVFGKYLASGNQVLIKEKFKQIETILWIVSIISFSTCLLLINQFVSLYINNINDANYYHPFFALIMTVAQFFYTARESYRLLILSAGKFRETNFGSFMEAFLNIVLSVALAIQFGITGVAIGTLVAIVYRLFYFIYYLKNNLINIRLFQFAIHFLTSVIVFSINIFIYYFVNFSINTFIEFILAGIMIVLMNSSLTILVYVLTKKLCVFICCKYLFNN